MNNQNDNKLAISVVATLTAGIAVIYILIAYPQLIFAVAGVSTIFLICAYILTQNIVNFINMKNKSLNVQIKNGMDDLSTQIEGMSSAQAQLGKATYLYTRQAAENVTTLRSNYADSQEALHKNLSVLANAQNKSTKLLIKYDQSNTTKLISTLKDIRNNLNDTMTQGFDQIQQPNNADVVAMLESIVDYLKSQPAGMDQSLGMQINNVAHELQNISSNIARVQSVPMQAPPMGMQVPPMGMQPVYQEMPPIQQTAPVSAQTPDIAAMSNTTDFAPQTTEDISAAEEPSASEPVLSEALTTDIGTHPDAAIEEAPVMETEPAPEPVIEEAPVMETEPAPEPVIEEAPVMETEPAPEPVIEEAPVMETEPAPEPVTEEAPVMETEPAPEPVIEKAPVDTAMPSAPVPTPVSDDPNKQLSPDEIAALFASAEPAPANEAVPEAQTEESTEAFTPTFTVVGKEEPAPEEPAPEPVTAEPALVSDDPNKQLSADEIAALFAAAEPAPKKEEPKKAPEPVAVAPVSDDPNKQLSADEIAALFAAAEPAPKKEEPAPEPVSVTPVSDDPNKQLSADEIAALFASIG